MHEILEKIKRLEYGDKFIFLKMLYDDSSALEEFYVLLNSAGDEDLENFLDTFDVQYSQMLRKELAETTPEEDKSAGTNGSAVSFVYGKVEDKKKELEENSCKAKEKAMKNRKDLKSGFGQYDDHLSDQVRGINPPPLSKKIKVTSSIIPLPETDESVLIKKDIFQCISDRKSRRKFTEEQLMLKELAWLLWATQGVRKSFSHNIHALRTVPSGGARHPFETYLAIYNVESLDPGLYRYMPFEHSLEFIGAIENLAGKVSEAALDQTFAGNYAVCFIWTAIPYRTEWRYTVKSTKIILQDSGHLCQNLYLASESIGCGTCAIGAYDQDKIDKLLQVDGENEFTVYMAPVGKV